MKNSSKRSLIAKLKKEGGKDLPLFYKGLEPPPPRMYRPPFILAYKKTCKGEMAVSNNYYKPITRMLKSLHVKK